jgi:hypothetical protein
LVAAQSTREIRLWQAASLALCNQQLDQSPVTFGHDLHGLIQKSISGYLKSDFQALSLTKVFLIFKKINVKQSREGSNVVPRSGRRWCCGIRCLLRVYRRLHFAGRSGCRPGENMKPGELTAEDDIELIRRWLSTDSLCAIAAELGLTQTAVEREWRRLRREGKLPSGHRTCGTDNPVGEADGRPSVGRLALGEDPLLDRLVEVHGEPRHAGTEAPTK